MSISARCFALPAICLFIGCSAAIPGSGVPKTEVRTIGEFNAISHGVVGTVNVTVGQPQSVSVTLDDNLVQFVKTDVVDGELRLSMSQNFQSDVGLKVEISVPSIQALNASGVGNLEATGIEAQDLSVKVSGVGSVRASGTVENLEVELSGVGAAKLADLKARAVKVKVSGVGSATVFASESVDASTSGVGSVSVLGQPKDRQTSETGVGRVRFEEQ